MLTSSLLVSTLLPLSTSVAAASTASTKFTFAQWIEDITADPAMITFRPRKLSLS